ncbi:MAG: DNA-binding protein [Prevotella sp.]|nr:DNA-binding protein [Prevotella sp.]
MNAIIKRLLLLLCFLPSLSWGQEDDGIEVFGKNSRYNRPWTFWYWMYGCVSDEGIRLDLQAMKDAGIAGFYLMPIKDVSDGEQYGGTARQLSPEWWKRMDTVFHVADSLGLEMGIHLSDGFALAGGPWITPEMSMQKVVWTDTIVEGGKGAVVLRQPETYQGYYEDIGVYAFPLSSGRAQDLPSSPLAHDPAKPVASVEFPFRSTEPCEILFTYDAPFTLRNVRIVTGGNNYQAHRWKVYSSTDGDHFDHVCDIQPARQGWQNTDAQATYSIPATTARFFKFCWTPEGSDPGSEDLDAAKWRPVLKVADLQLGSEAVVDGYEGKSGLVWRVSGQNNRSNRSDRNDRSNQSDWSNQNNQMTPTILPAGGTAVLPPGLWRVLRMGHTSSGHTNATGGGGRGLECDKFSKKAIREQLTHWFDTIFQHNNGHGIHRLHVDSWECGSQNWGERFAQEFERRRGYDLLPWLPVYAGVPVGGSERADSVLRDIRLTIAELVDEVFFAEMERYARAHGVKLSAECVAPTMVSDGLLHFRHADLPMGEFWLNSPTHDKPNDMLDAISAAHTYGKDIIQAEGFTEVRGTWDETPALLKPLLDRNYCLGINSIVLHVNTHNPWPDRKPGMTLDGIGTFFQRDNTWWREMPAFTRYVTLTQKNLQAGQPVVDLAVYIGDEVPRRALLPERLTDILPGLFGDSLLHREALRLANEGQPLETSPVGVTHTKNMTKAEDWVNPLHGYKYDSFNHDVLDGMRVEDGVVVTRDGMRYAAIVVPGAHKMNPGNIITGSEKIKELRRQGATIIDRPWTAADLSGLGIHPDIILPPGIDFTHRHDNNVTAIDYYFLCNTTDTAITYVPRCRAQGKHHYLHDTMDGTICLTNDTITLHPGASIFFIVTDKEYPRDKLTPQENSRHYRRQPSQMTEVSGEWQLTFEMTGQHTTSDLGKGWQEYDDPTIKYYSGHATYETTFKFKGKALKTIKTLETGKIRLRLNEVHDIATVYVNDICCGTSWFPPHLVDITKAVRPGKNTLRIEVVNTWANALQGSDNDTPPYDGIWTNAKYRRAEKDLLPAGLGKGVFIEY